MWSHYIPSATCQRNRATDTFFYLESYNRPIAQEPVASLPQQTQQSLWSNWSNQLNKEQLRQKMPISSSRQGNREQKLHALWTLLSFTSFKKNPNQVVKWNTVFYLNASMASQEESVWQEPRKTNRQTPISPKVVSFPQALCTEKQQLWPHHQLRCIYF